MEQEPLDQWIEDQSRKEAERRLAALFAPLLDGFDEWAARQKRLDRRRLMAVTFCAMAAACGLLLAFAPAPDIATIDRASQPFRAEVCALADEIMPAR